MSEAEDRDRAIINKKIESKREWAKRFLLAERDQGRDLHLLCIELMETLIPDTDGPEFTDEYVSSLLDWVFADDPVTLEEWHIQ